MGRIKTVPGDGGASHAVFAGCICAASASINFAKGSGQSWMEFRRLWENGLGKLAAVYVLSLFGFVIWVGLLISWIFFSGIKPPLVS